MFPRCRRRFLTDEGIAYLREYLALPAEIVPATLKQSNRPLERLPGGPRGDRRGPRPDRGEYRSAAPAAGAAGKDQAPADFKPQFQ